MPPGTQGSARRVTLGVLWATDGAICRREPRVLDGGSPAGIAPLAPGSEQISEGVAAVPRALDGAMRRG